MSIDHTTEVREVAETGHELGCFERVAEELVEEGTAESGAWDEILAAYGHRELIDVFAQIVTEDHARCFCPRTYED